MLTNEHVTRSLRSTSRVSLDAALSKVRSGSQDYNHHDYDGAGGLEVEAAIVLLLDEVSRNNTRKETAVEADTLGLGQEDPEKRGGTESVLGSDGLPPKDKGWRAWTMALVILLAFFSTWGVNSLYGIFLNYYTSSGEFPDATKYDYALIGGIVIGLAQGFAPLSALLIRVLGLRVVLIIGIVLQTAGYILASFATNIWQLYLTQGVLVGASFACIYLPATLVVPSWFDKKASTAMGIGISGIGLGGVIFSLALNKVIQDTGDQRWALRMLGIITAATVSVVCLVLRPREGHNQLPYSTTFTKKYLAESAGAIFDWTVFKDSAFLALGLWYALSSMIYMITLFTVSSYAFSIGLSPHQGSVVTAVLNAFQVIGRPMLGFLADRYGRINFSFFACLLNAVLILAFWINCHNFGALLGFVIVSGLVVGVGTLMVQPMLLSIYPDNKRISGAWSAINLVGCPFALASEVIAMSLRKETAHPYLDTQIFIGVTFFFCALLLLYLRQIIVARKLNERLAAALALVEKKKNACSELEGSDASKTNEDEVPTDEAEIHDRIDHFQKLLQPSLAGYFVRIWYPVRV